jgi:hypothetical protein
MDWHAVLRWIAPPAGVLLITLIFLDVFLTVLYARIGTGILSHPTACLTWRAFRLVARPFPTHRGQILSFAGPCMLPLMVCLWIAGLTFGFALILWPALGTAIVATTGPTPTDFSSALYVAGDSMTTVGTSDLAPKTPFFRLLYTFCSFTGLSVLTLTLTYFLQVYNALQRRNTFTLKIHVATAESADAAELLAGLGPEGNFDRGYSQFAEFAAEMTGFQESHHFYPVIFYFRFKEPQYDAARAAMIILDAVSLIKSGLDDRRYAWLKESAAVSQLWRGSMRLLVELSDAFLPNGDPGSPPPVPPDPLVLDRWRARYAAALRRMRQAGIQTVADEDQALDTYLELRSRWDHYIFALTSHMAFDQKTIDPVTMNPATSDRRRDFTKRLRDVG